LRKTTSLLRFRDAIRYRFNNTRVAPAGIHRNLRATMSRLEETALRGTAMSRFAFDHLLLARILFTLTTAGWAVGTVIADFNQTHATNPKWTPHARFHVVWQILSYAGFGLLALALLWWPGPMAAERITLAALFSVIVFGAFYAALFSMPVYGGHAYDDNGYRPFDAPVPLIAEKWDVNITVFSIQIVLLAAGVIALAA
jgi:uncharacterized membrane protein